MAASTSEGKIAIKGVGAGVGHVLAVPRKIAGIFLGRAFERLLRVLSERLEHMVAEVNQQPIEAAVFLGNVLGFAIVRQRFPVLVGDEAQDVGDRSRLDVVRNGRAAGPFGRNLGLDRVFGIPAGRISVGRGGLLLVFLRDFPDFVEAERDGLGRLARQNPAFEVILRQGRLAASGPGLGGGRRRGRGRLFGRSGFWYRDGFGGFLRRGGLFGLGHDGRRWLRFS
jgi:hypothetical protein